MRISRMVLRLCLVLILFVSLHATCYASKADELLSQAEKKVAAAEKAKGVDQIEGYTDAIKIFQKVETDNVGTPQGAEAGYKVSKIDAAMADASHNDKDRHNYLYAAYDNLRRLLNVYDKPKATLEEQNLTSSEAKNVLAVVADARALKDKCAHRLNGLNSKDFKYKILDFFVGLTGRSAGFSYWFAIILITVIVKVILTPLTHAQFRSMKEMQKITPLIKEIQAKYKGDQKTIGEKTMALYKEHSINPFASCLPMILQLPITIGLFYMMRSYEFQFANGTFLWIGSRLAHTYSFQVPFSVGQVSWFTAGNLAEPDFIILILYLVSMYLQTKISAVDPTQAEQQKMMSIVMPIMFAFILAGFPSAFLLYWLVFNVLQTAQQYYILKSGRTEVIVPAPAPPTPPEPEEKPSGETQRIKPKKHKKHK